MWHMHKIPNGVNTQGIAYHVLYPDRRTLQFPDRNLLLRIRNSGRIQLTRLLQKRSQAFFQFLKLIDGTQFPHLNPC